MALRLVVALSLLSLCLEAEAAGPTGDSPHPIVVVHGWSGWEQIKLVGDHFRNVPAALAKDGHRVFVARINPFGTDEERAGQLRDYLEQVVFPQTGAKQVVILSHSQGGRTARVLASPGGLNYGHKIKRLLTVATPHHEVELVRGLERIPLQRTTSRLAGSAVRQVTRWQPDFQAVLGDMGDAGSREFNARYPVHPGVEYYSVAGAPSKRDVHVLLKPTHKLLASRAGPNDGVVSEASARYGRFLGTVNADHWALIGRPVSRRFDHLAFWRGAATFVQDPRSPLARRWRQSLTVPAPRKGVAPKR